MAGGQLIRLDRHPSGEMVWRDEDVIIRKTDSGIVCSGSGVSGKTISGSPKSGLPGQEENRFVLSIGPKARRPFRVDLPSGDRIWLNNASQLAYNADLRAGEDPVLDGEALFDIKKDNAFRPLRVRTKKGEVLTVLGTSFAVRSVAGEPQSKVELFSGKVQVKSQEDSVILRPQSAAVIEEGKTPRLVRLETPRAMPVWMRPREKGATFEFDNTPLAVALQEVAAWYLMNLSDLNGVAGKGSPITGRMQRSESLDNTLRTLEGIEDGRIVLQRRGDTIVVLRGKTLSD
jgi:ferric-dicitrate binding protein FerR (iron transport regulator)